MFSKERKETRKREETRKRGRPDDTLARVCMCDCVWVSDGQRKSDRPVCGLRKAEAVCVRGRDRRAGGRMGAGSGSK